MYSIFYLFAAQNFALMSRDVNFYEFYLASVCLISDNYHIRPESTKIIKF